MVPLDQKSRLLLSGVAVGPLPMYGTPGVWKVPFAVTRPSCQCMTCLSGFESQRGTGRGGTGGLWIIDLDLDRVLDGVCGRVG